MIEILYKEIMPILLRDAPQTMPIRDLNILEHNG